MRSGTSCLLTSLALLGILASPARAELLGSFERQLGANYGPLNPPFDGRVQVDFRAQPLHWQSGFEFWLFGGTGGPVSTAANVGVPLVLDGTHPGFAAFARQLSDGRLSTLRGCFLLLPYAPLLGTCDGRTESQDLLTVPPLIPDSPDWQGYRIDEVWLTISSMAFVPYFDWVTGETWTIFQGSLRLEVHGEALPPLCQDGLDDDFDGLVDLADPGCSSPDDLTENDPSLPCDDNLSNDGDLLFDVEQDPGCKDAWFPLEDPACQDGIDNDGALGIDFDGGNSANRGRGALDVPDPHCTVPWKNKEVGPTCGLGFEAVLLLAPILVLRRQRARRERSRP